GFLGRVPWFSVCLVEGSEVTQIPTILWGLKDSDSQMNCSHTKGLSYFQMYWYRQLPGEGMKQVVYTSTYNRPDYGDFSEDKYPTIKTTAKSGSFTVKKVEDTGLYYCAVSKAQCISYTLHYTQNPSPPSTLHQRLSIMLTRY
uniref:Ig-like domain-containing protein n=1 Tax=Salmo trutta TaxID=8032 RepID=A0A673YT10_SALTR